DSQQIADRVGVFSAIETMYDVAAWGTLARPGAIQRSTQPGRKTRVLGFGGTGHAWRRHRPHTQLPKDSFPRPRVAHQIVKARRLEINRVLPRRRRLFVVTSNA